jgi:uncharacterized membrane protein YkgB
MVRNAALAFAAALLYLMLAILFLWMGLLKFYAYEAHSLALLVASNPLIAWLKDYLDAEMMSRLVGSVEIAIGFLLICRTFSPGLAALGSLGAVVTLAITSSFLFTAPGFFVPEFGSPALSMFPGQFLLKDVVLMAAALVLYAEARSA